MSWPYGVISLVVRGQRVYVVHESSDQSKPILFRDYWPTIHSVHELPNEWETRYKSLESQGGGFGGYTFWYEGNGLGNYMSIVLMFRGQTESIKRDVLAILPPKTKQETRYQDGRWQRYLKSDKRGWIDCHPWQVAQPLSGSDQQSIQQASGSNSRRQIFVLYIGIHSRRSRTKLRVLCMTILICRSLKDLATKWWSTSRKTPLSTVTVT